ncbi:MAG: nucleotide sugar dehydrogenase, partial [Saprospiraceae bacterium]|nr:nucleotide sugar dehydrogenase [Saprospiraceae bacterium]
TLVDQISNDYDAVVIAVNHDEYKQYDAGYFQSITKSDPILMDLKGIYQEKPNGLTYWRL